MSRWSIGALALAVAGVHCSAPAGEEAPVTTDPVDFVPGAGARDDAEEPPAKEEPARDDARGRAWFEGNAPRLLAPELAPLVRDGADTVVTSTVRDADGSLYATGTFIGNIAIGPRILYSRGSKDIFLVKVDRRSRFVWARALGSAGAERAPRVSISEGRVSVIAMTKGDVDCGKGPMPVWSTETFFMCSFRLADGAPIVGGAFPTGRR
jgi:hypothetical protein